MSVKRVLLLIAGSIVVTVAAVAATPEPADLILAGGTIYDGSDAAPRRGDVVIRGDKIVYVGSDGPQRFNAARVIDVTGKVVAPGFIDPHTHPEEFIHSADAAQR